MADEAGSSPDEGLTTRERRAQRVRAEQRRQLPATVVKRGAITVAIIVAIAAIGWAGWKLSSLNDCEMDDKHEHATFAVFDRGERLRFQHPRFDMASPGSAGILPQKAHLHQPNDSQLHLEYGCATLGQFFGYMGMQLKSGKMVLDKETHAGLILESSGNLTLKFFLFLPDPARPLTNGTWVEKADLPGHQMRDFQRALITFGDLTAEQIKTQQGQVPAPTDSQPPRTS